VFIFKLVNIIVLYIVKNLAIISSERDVCPLYDLANQFAFLIIIDITFTALLELMLPIVVRKCCTKQENGQSAEESKPEFHLADEYVSVTYRQFIVFFGMPVMPFMPFLGLAGSCIDYWFDKIRLLRIAGKPKRTNNTYKNVLLFFYLLMAFCVLLGYPIGMPFVLSGSAGLASNAKCYVYA